MLGIRQDMSHTREAKVCKWKATFKLRPDIEVKQIRDLPDVRLITKDRKNRKRMTGIEVTTPDLSFVDAINYSTLLANRCADIISYTNGIGVSCSLKQINEIGPAGEVKTGGAFLSCNAILVKPQEIDIANTAFLNVLRSKDEKLSRQLSHYRRAIASSDIVEKLREFYLVLEDEYPKNHRIRHKYKYARNLVSHAKLIWPESAREAKRILGKPYLDPSAPSDMQALQRHVDDIKGEAKKCIETKI